MRLFDPSCGAAAKATQLWLVFSPLKALDVRGFHGNNKRLQELLLCFLRWIDMSPSFLLLVLLRVLLPLLILLFQLFVFLFLLSVFSSTSSSSVFPSFSCFFCFLFLFLLLVSLFLPFILDYSTSFSIWSTLFPPAPSWLRPLACIFNLPSCPVNFLD